MSLLEEIKQELKDSKKRILSKLKIAIPHAENYSELSGMADIAYEIDMHDYLGLLFADRAKQLEIDEISVGEYDHDRVFLKIREVPEEDDYYGYCEVDIGDWVSSNY